MLEGASQRRARRSQPQHGRPARRRPRSAGPRPSATTGAPPAPTTRPPPRRPPQSPSRPPPSARRQPRCRRPWPSPSRPRSRLPPWSPRPPCPARSRAGGPTPSSAPSIRRKPPVRSGTACVRRAPELAAFQPRITRLDREGQPTLWRLRADRSRRRRRGQGALRRGARPQHPLPAERRRRRERRVTPAAAAATAARGHRRPLRPALTAAEAATWRATPPLGAILFGRNIEDPDQLRALVADIRTELGEEAPILVDQEGGRVARLRAAALAGIPPRRRLRRPAARRVRGAVRANAALLGLACRDAGFDVVCAPVLDLRLPGQHEIIGDRAFAADPAEVARLGRASVLGLQEAGCVPVDQAHPRPWPRRRRQPPGAAARRRQPRRAGAGLRPLRRRSPTPAPGR